MQTSKHSHTVQTTDLWKTQWPVLVIKGRYGTLMVSLLNSFVCTQDELWEHDGQEDSSYMERHVWT